MHTFCKKYITYLNEWFVKKRKLIIGDNQINLRV